MLVNQYPDYRRIYDVMATNPELQRYSNSLREHALSIESFLPEAHPHTVGVPEITSSICMIFTAVTREMRFNIGVVYKDYSSREFQQISKSCQLYSSFGYEIQVELVGGIQKTNGRGQLVHCKV